MRMSLTRRRQQHQQQRKLFLLVFLCACFCLLIFKTTSLFPSSASSSSIQQQQQQQQEQLPQQHGLVGAVASYQIQDEESAEAAAALVEADGHPSHHQLDARSAAIPAPSAVSSSPSTSSSSLPSVNLKHHQHKLTTNSLTTSSHHQQAAAGLQHDDAAACHYEYPNLFDLQFNNIHWQKAKIESPTNSTATKQTAPATYYLYNAYYDDRWRGGVPSVRVLAMIDRITPPPTNCLLWSSKLSASPSVSSATTSSSGAHTAANKHNKLRPLVSRAQFVYAWYPKWGNYKDGLLQPWIVTCPIPRGHVGLVPESVSLVRVPALVDEHPVDPTDPMATATTTAKLARAEREAATERSARQSDGSQQQQQAANSIAMPPSFSSSSPTVMIDSSEQQQQQQPQQVSQLHPAGQIRSHQAATSKPLASKPKLNCKSIGPITNNLPVFNHRPSSKQKFAVCVKGLDFPHEDVSVRLVEWIEMLNLLGAGKIFLYELDVHENISKVLSYYQKRGLVELSPLTLPGDQPNLPEYQHLYLKNRLTSKRQNELIPYNDCLYRNLYSYQYLALLDIDEVIMPLKQQNWFGLMEQIEAMSLAEQNYSRASYNVRNVYFFDDLSGPLGTTSPSESDLQQQVSSSSSEAANQVQAGDHQDEQPNDGSKLRQSLEKGIPHYLHMMSHVYRSKNYTEPGQYVKCFHNTERVVSLHNHFPMNCFGQCTTYSIPVGLAHLQHYRKDCVGPLRQSCKNDFRVFTTRDTTIWKYKQQMIRRTTRVLNHLGLLEGGKRRQEEEEATAAAAVG